MKMALYFKCIFNYYYGNISFLDAICENSEFNDKKNYI